MNPRRLITVALLGKEVLFSVSRSSGPGGQNVNKVNSKVTLKFNISTSEVLTEEEKEVLERKLQTKLTTEGALLLSAQDSRSQLQNKEEVVLKFERLLANAFIKKKVRKSTKPTKGAVQDRLKGKKQNAEKKKWRQRPI